MPELPEVETVKRGLSPAMEGAVLTRVEQRRKNLRFPFPARFAARLTGRRILGLSRRAKYILADLDDGAVLIMHLGMSGRFLVEAPGSKPLRPGEFHHDPGKESAHDHVVFHLSSGARITYNDTRRFGFMDLVPRAEIETCRHFSGMGVEPLGNALDDAVLAALFSGKKAPLKAALLDQRLVAGLGNIYVCEVLNRMRLSPERGAGTLVTAKGAMHGRGAGLAAAIRSVLEEAIEAGGSTLRDYAHTDGSLGYFQHRFRSYDREGEPCLNAGCKGTISRLVQSGRSTFYCRTCQK